MNTTWQTEQSNPPQEGDVYYDIPSGETKIFVVDKWVNLGSTPINEVRFCWAYDAYKLPYVRITDMHWFTENRYDLLKWLDEVQAGSFLPDLNAIIFESKEMATLFKLKWSS